jgi:hypothetical protein
MGYWLRSSFILKSLFTKSVCFHSVNSFCKRKVMNVCPTEICIACLMIAVEK